MSQSTSPLSTADLNGDDVQVSVHRKPACRIELHVKASPFLVKMARKEAIKAVNKEVSLPGFRKGKAPEETIAKKFPNDVEKRLHKAIADLAFIQAQKKEKVAILNNNAPVNFDLKSHSEEGAELLFTFETEPVVPSIDPNLFQQKPVEKTEVTDTQTDEAIRQMLFFYANWKLIEDRPIQEGDYIMIDLDTIDGETSQRVFNHIRFEVSSQRMANWMKALVLGAKSGDVLEGMSEPDDSLSEEEKKEFKPKKIRLSILKVEEATLPELNDEFAKKVGAPDVAAMRKSVTDMLNAQAEQKVEQALREQINEFFVKQYVFDLPQSLIDAEKKHRFQQMAQDLRFRKKWQEMSKEEQKNLDQNLNEESAQAVRLFYLSRQVIREKQIPITHREVEQEAIASIQGNTRQRVDVDQIPKEVFALALSKVMLLKAQNVVLQYKK